jgi:L-threonylcarbamoyladenylate synthase
MKGEAAVRTFILLVGTVEQAGHLVSEYPGVAQRLIADAWPGSLTLVLPASERVPGELRRGGMLAVRCPDDRFLRELVLSLPDPLISTSANRSGADPPAKLSDVPATIRAACQVTVDRGLLCGTGSTVVRPEADGTLTVLRPGLWEPEGWADRIR